MISAELRALLADKPLPHRLRTETINEAVARGFGSLLFTTAKRQGCAIDRPAAHRLAALQLRAMNRHDKKLRDLVLVADHATRHGAPLRLFKGLASSYALYGQPHDRPSADIDIYVGSWSSAQRRGVFGALGVDPRQIEAIEELVLRGRPLHEVTVDGAEGVMTANIDAHFNPYGLLTRFRAVDVPGCWRSFAIPGTSGVETPTPELALVIALLNQTRKGGGSLWYAADAARLLNGRAGAIDWCRFAALAKADGLDAICAHALWSLVDGIGLDPNFPIKRPRGSRRWSPTVGEGPLALTRRMTLVPLYRSPRLVPEALAALVRWYLPSRLSLDARGVALGDRGPQRRFRAMRTLAGN